VHDVLDELDCFGYAVFYEWFVLDPLGELVNSHKDVLETALGFLKRSLDPSPSRRTAKQVGCR
jgi:hypothetical protein